MSLFCQDDYLHIINESKLGPKLYRATQEVFGSIPGAHYSQDEYKWYIPKQAVDTVAKHFEDVIVWNTDLHTIKGIEEVALPQMEVTDEGLEDMKLKPYPFQVVGISFLHDNKRGVIGDEMGLGS